MEGSYRDVDEPMHRTPNHGSRRRRNCAANGDVIEVNTSPVDNTHDLRPIGVPNDRFMQFSHTQLCRNRNALYPGSRINGMRRNKDSVTGKNNESKDDDKSLKSSNTITSVLEAHGYILNKTIGQGSYATVKLARSTIHEANVAIKIISKKRAPSDYLDKFLPREIDVVKNLKHPRVVLFLQCIETTQRVYIIMEMCTQGDLLSRVRKGGRLEEEQAYVWFHHLTDGVEYVHSKGYVHRDLKCENLLIDDRNGLKITDFGFARNGIISDSTELKSGNLSETYCGSYAYASPEILTGTPYNPRSADIWSMGVVLYVMVYGRLPFNDSDHRKLLKEVIAGPRFPKSVTNISKRCQDIIVAIMAPFYSRLNIQAIREHSWYRKHPGSYLLSNSMATSTPEEMATIHREDSGLL